MSFNFFDWVRQGVKDSVLRGVSDAVETIGMPEDEATSRAKMLKFLRDDAAEEEPPRRRVNGNGNSSGTGTRKLGRSLSEIHPAKAS